MTTIASPLCRIAQYAPASWVPELTDIHAGDAACVCRGVRQLGFDSLLFSHDMANDGASYALLEGPDSIPDIEEVAEACRQSELSLLIDVDPPRDATPQAVERWHESVLQRVRYGVAGVRCLGLSSLSAQQWQQFCGFMRHRHPDLQLTAWTPGLTYEQLHTLSVVGFDGCFSSLAWWDQYSPWLVQEFEYLRRVAPVIASPVVARDAPALDPRMLVGDATLVQRMWVAAYMGQGMMMDAQRALDPGLSQSVSDVNRWLAQGHARPGRLALLSGPLSSNAILYWVGGASCALVLHQRSQESFSRALGVLRARLPDGYTVVEDRTKQCEMDAATASLVFVQRSVPVKARHLRADDRIAPELRGGRDRGGVGSRAQWALKLAMNTDRIVIDRVTPHVDRGRFAVKLILGRVLQVEATVFADGHAPLAVSLLWRAADQTQWRQVAMHPSGNDRWRGQCVPERLGRHYYTIQAWVDSDEPAHRTRQCPILPLQVERLESEYSSWYELFPRSMGEPGQHGHLLDVIAHLPRIRAMGFDVLYFPPIHPIGHTNRKGRNNSLNAQPGDPGSPYAIGAETGGHAAIHPELGTLDDFRTLLVAARDHEIEIALDFAIQCSPDHPWLREHPEWFHWREDGTVQYAENPPKRYEDIVNPDFYSATAGPGQRMALWRGLRDIVLFWADQGVRMFRVDNPHTKPLPFWEWMIAEVQRYHPDAVFLSEAFTRPEMMHRLAKLGFSQSYTYFTWRNTKAELTDYLTELTAAAQLNYFRPHFFVNTPDINPYFLQSSGRAGFLIRAALAATTSGLWGAYSGFELCEAQALPGREEYQDSEKYQLRTRDWNQPGHIVSEITQLNAIRRANPALQTHRGIRFHPVDDVRVLFFSKTTYEGDNIVLVAISLSPWETLSVRLELAPWIRSRKGDVSVRLRSLWDGQVHVVMTGELQVTLKPEQPFVLWSVLP